MKLSEILNKAAVKIPLSSSTKDDVIKELVGLLEKAHGLDSKGEILSKVMQRESMMSTGIGNGVAIPHGKTAAIDNLYAACGVSKKGIDFDSVDGEPSTLFILLVSPEDFRGPHVKTLANISRLLKEEKVREDLRKSETANRFLANLKEAEETYL